MNLDFLKEELVGQVEGLIKEKTAETTKSSGGGLFGSISSTVSGLASAGDAKSEIMDIVMGLMKKHNIGEDQKESVLQQLQPTILKLVTKYLAAK